MIDIPENWVRIDRGRLVRFDGCEVTLEKSLRASDRWVAMVVENSGVRFVLKTVAGEIMRFESARKALDAVETYLKDGTEFLEVGFPSFSIDSLQVSAD